jgi:predicted CopG family antitoxin
MSATISVANDVIRMLDRFKEEASKTTGKDQPSYSDVIRFLFARQKGIVQITG